ncbi:MAG: HPr(Ser) kinase/phosphatase [Spirochaetes bacterium]|nr:HPr(Ser) kinase/phosphatase [Spirochaetota bacterium]
MEQKKLCIRDLLGPTGNIDLQLQLVAGERGLSKLIPGTEMNRPGLTLAGFYDFFAFDRIQIFGLGETAFLEKLPIEKKIEVYNKFFSFDILCCVFTHSLMPDSQFLAIANEKGVPIMVTRHKTTRFISLVTHVIEEFFAPSITMHGTLVEVFGIGVLLIGKSGVGKSETALELIERNHRLVADDIVEIRKIDESLLMGSGSEIVRHHLEIRGLGIINVKELYGIGAVRNRKRIELVVLLEEWDASKYYDRLGIDEHYYTILDINVPFITVPVRPGRNIPIIIETAALNQRLKKMGVYTAQELDARIQEWIKRQQNSHDGKGNPD